MSSSGSFPPNFHGGDFGGLNSSSDEDSFFDGLPDIETLPSLLSNHDNFDVSELEICDMEIHSDPPSSYDNSDVSELEICDIKIHSDLPSNYAALGVSGFEIPPTLNSSPGSNAEIEKSKPSSSGKNRGGRPKKMVTKEALLKCETSTLKEVADEYRVSVSTLKRRRRDKVEVQDEVEVQLVYQERQIAFYLPSEATEQELREDIKAALELPDPTNYDFKYFAGSDEFSLGSGSSFLHCMRNASQLSDRPHKFIKLMVKDVIN